MTDRKTPLPPYTWVQAPVGWWFVGRWCRKLAHTWPGADRLWRGVTFDPYGVPSEVSTPFPAEEAALNHYSELLTPKEKSA